MHVAIIGAGAAGSMAAWRLAVAGHQVTILEQFAQDHDRGSSYGDSRIVRRVYPDPLYTGLMAEAYSLWDELQNEWAGSASCGPCSDEAELIRRAGGLYFGNAGNGDVEAAEAALKTNSVAFEKLNSAEVSNRFPPFHLPADTVALYEPSMGYARASNAIRAASALAIRAGASYFEESSVTAVNATSNGIKVTAGDRTINADRALITAGSWTNSFLHRMGAPAPITVTRQVYVHLEPDSMTESYEANTFPVWIDIGTNMYGFPRTGRTRGIKIASHNRGIVTEPNTVERTIAAEDLDGVLRYAKSRLPSLSDRVVYSKVCLYSNTPDEDFIIDVAPGIPGAFVISACSGHGFKFAPLIGQIGAELALGSARRDLARFSLARFG